MVARPASTRLGWSHIVHPIRDRAYTRDMLIVSWTQWSMPWMAKPTGSSKSGIFIDLSTFSLLSSLLRNPWGNTGWSGAWSDGSAEWTPVWMERLKHKFGDDGVGRYLLISRDVLTVADFLDVVRRPVEEVSAIRSYSHIWAGLAHHPTVDLFTRPVVCRLSSDTVLSQCDKDYTCCDCGFTAR